MATTTLLPNGDGSRVDWTDQSSGTSNLYQTVDELVASANDSDYVVSITSPNSMFFLLENMPGDFDVITAIDVQIRAKKEVGGLRTATVQIFESDETTALTDAQSTTGLTNGVWNDFTLTLSLTGATDKTSWDGARLKLTGTDDGVDVSAIEADITYTVASPPTPTYTLTAAAGSFSLSGQAASLEYHRKLTAAKATFTLTGVATAMQATRKLSALPAVFQLTGKPATFRYGSYELTAEAATFSLSGIDADLKASKAITAQPATFTLTANDAPSNLSMLAETATFALTGGNASMRTGTGMVASGATFTLTGISAGMLATPRKVTASTAAFTLTARPVAFPPRKRVLLALGTTFTLTGNSVTDLGTLKAQPATFGVSANPAGLAYTPLDGRSFGCGRSRIFQSHTIGA